MFTQRLTAEDEARIQLDYEDMLRQRKVEMARRAAQRVDTTPTTGELVNTYKNV